MKSAILIFNNEKIKESIINDNDRKEFKPNKRFKEYRQFKYKNRKAKKLEAQYLLNYLIILILLNPIFSIYSISVTIRTGDSNSFVPILYTSNIGGPSSIIPQFNADNEDLTKYESNYLKYKCQSGTCTIQLKWDISNTAIVLESTSEINASQMFKNCDKIISIDFSEYRAKDIRNMNRMFDSCTSLETINNLNLKNVYDFSYAFNNCNKLINIGINNIDITYNLDIDMKYMFADCKKLETINFPGFNFNKYYVKDMSYMFYNCESLKSVDLSYSSN